MTTVTCLAIVQAWTRRNMNTAYWIGRKLLGLYRFFFIGKIYARGIEHIPPGPKIIVANHANVTDSFTLPLVMSEKLHFVIQGSVFDLPVLGKLLKRAEQVPCYAEQGLKMIHEAQKKLNQGGCVIIFPEGRLNNNEQLLKAGIGAAMLAEKANVPVVPLGFYVSRKNVVLLQRQVFRNYVSRGGFQWRGECMLHFGKPLIFSMEDGTKKIHTSLRKVTTQIMEEIKQLVENARQDSENTNTNLSEQLTVL
jgi:1-acyl-sn-glycerol-3-phosphate acyltransferase